MKEKLSYISPSLKSMGNLETALKEVEPSIINVLSKEDAKAILDLKDTFVKILNTQQIYRTETEMRVSVLNDGNHPTNASKYWQAVREMGSMFEEIIRDSFNLRRHAIQKDHYDIKLQKAIDKGNTIKQRYLEIDMEEWHYNHQSQERQLKDRIREVKIWSKILEELNDGSFDDTDVNQHQVHSYSLAFKNKANAIPETASSTEVVNVIGPLATLQRLQTKEGKIRGFDNSTPELKQNN